MHSQKGFVLTEGLIALALSTILFASLIMTFIGVKSMNKMSRHRIQAMQVVRGQLDLLKVSAFAQIVDSTANVPYDAGRDGVFGNADDLSGTLTVTVRDFMDMDNDGNVNETAIDVDGTGGNDTAAARPVRVSFTWGEYILGSQKNMTVSVDTLIAA